MWLIVTVLITRRAGIWSYCVFLAGWKMVDLGLSGWVWALGLRPFETERMMLVR